jgi:release factor glutamine methyltransferase
MRGIKELREKMIQDLCEIYPENESRQMVNLLILSVTGWEKEKIAIEPGIIVVDSIVDNLLKGLGELLKGKPIQYVTGKAYFYGLELDVNPSVLIPRPETEELVKWIVDDNSTKEGLNVLDIGTGSGCILIALGKLLKKPGLKGVEISKGALETASNNAIKHGIPVVFRLFDILKDNGDGALKYDIIVSNPPYVREMEKALMNNNVLGYEPHSALFVPDGDPLLFYKAIAGFAKNNLVPGGKLYLEINENLGKETISLLESEGFRNVTLEKDMQGKDRMIKCVYYEVKSSKES